MLVGESALAIDTFQSLIAEEEALALRARGALNNLGGTIGGLGLGQEGHGLTFSGNALQRQIVLWSWLAKAHLENDDAPQVSESRGGGRVVILSPYQYLSIPTYRYVHKPPSSM